MHSGIRLLLVRHGESVDNVAGLYAGSRDSSLSSHGVLQAKALAKHLAERPDIQDAASTHFFASPLDRAFHTAKVVRDALVMEGSHPVSEVVRSEYLREKHFGSLEGVKFGRLGPYASSQEPEDTPESSDSMMIRANSFVVSHLLPVIRQFRSGPSSPRVETVIIVSHGILLNHLARALLGTFQSSGRPILGLTINHGPGEAHLHLPWRNTGYFECLIDPEDASVLDLTEFDTAAILAGMKLTIQAINRTEHLVGLKRTRGGIGSAQFDTSQKTLDSFVTKKT